MRVRGEISLNDIHWILISEDELLRLLPSQLRKAPVEQCPVELKMNEPVADPGEVEVRITRFDVTLCKYFWVDFVSFTSFPHLLTALLKPY